MNLYPNYFTFTFVRNPYERFVSLFLHASRQYAARGFPGDLGTLRDFAELCRDVLGSTGHLWGRESLDFFRENGKKEYGPGRVKLKHLAYVMYHTRPQVNFLPDCNPQRLFGVRRDDDAPLSFIGTVEDVEADFQRLRAILGLPAFELPNRQHLRTRNGQRAPQEIPWVLRRRDAPAGGGSLRRGPGVHRLRLRGRPHDGRRCGRERPSLTDAPCPAPAGGNGSSHALVVQPVVVRGLRAGMVHTPPGDPTPAPAAREAVPVSPLTPGSTTCYGERTPARARHDVEVAIETALDRKRQGPGRQEVRGVQWG